MVTMKIFSGQVQVERTVDLVLDVDVDVDFDTFYQTDIFWLFSDFMTRSEREETIRSCSLIPPTAPTFLAFSDQLQVIPATK